MGCLGSINNKEEFLCSSFSDPNYLMLSYQTCNTIYSRAFFIEKSFAKSIESKNSLIPNISNQNSLMSSMSSNVSLNMNS